MSDLSIFCCLNPDCSDFKKRGAGNIRVHGHHGKHHDIRMLVCKTCGKYFSERTGTVLYNRKLPKQKVIDILKHLAEGCGIRKTARLTGAHRDTVMSILKDAGGQAKALHDELVQELTVNELQLDEKWSFVGKKTKTAIRKTSQTPTKATTGTTCPLTRRTNL